MAGKDNNLETPKDEWEGECCNLCRGEEEWEGSEPSWTIIGSVFSSIKN